MEKKWWQSSVVYQIYPRSFADSNGDGMGDIPGIIGKIEYLKKLGVNVLWICPIYQSAQMKLFILKGNLPIGLRSVIVLIIFSTT